MHPIFRVFRPVPVCFGLTLILFNSTASGSSISLKETDLPAYDSAASQSQPIKNTKSEKGEAPSPALIVDLNGDQKKTGSAASIQTIDQSIDAPEERLLGLRDVLSITLQNNVAIAVQEYQTGIRQQEITGQDAVFDPSIVIEGRANENESQIASAFAAPDISNNERQSWKVGLSQKLVTGTQYELNYTGFRDETNSAFAGLNPQYTSRVEVNVTQPLLKNFGIDTNKKDIFIAQNNLDISEYEFKSGVIDIITNAENTYWDLVFTREDLKVKKQSVKRAQDLERRVRAQVRVGTLAPIEILQAQSEVASREEGVLLAEKAIADAEDQLKNIMNINFDSQEGKKEFKPLDPADFMLGKKIVLSEAITEALENRPDFLVRKKELENQNINVKFNENQLYPSLDLVGTFGLNGLSGTAGSIQQFGGGSVRSRFGGNYGQSLDDVFSGDFKNWEVGLLLNYPIGNRAAESRLTASRLQAAQLLLEIKDLEKSIVVEVRQASRQILTDIKRVHAARVARRLAEEKLAAEEKKFAVGLSTSFEVLEFQTDLAEQESRELKAIIDYKKSLSNFKKVKASTLTAHNISLDSRAK
ncbi:MAG: TolC family protein [Candidatus Nitronauta litoralis]|uniref:TolC family protein n=1 Tax=Candidatus Nitronauta litoralis TaxID=2705533 RepID=A0A7T0BYJ3_9BACT|nr:MAG: TolC family protein [Candidatus Nitronauta litoralis]